MAITFHLILQEIGIATGGGPSHTEDGMISAGALLVALALAPAWQEDSGLPPGVLLLSRIKRHVREQVERLPDYTCLETAVRYRNRGARPIDVVMLEVLNAGTKELYGSPGARDFSSENPSAFTAGGMTGTGTFGLHLRTLFVNDNAMFTYRGEEEVGGRPAVRYDYRVPQLMSGFTIHRAYARGVVGMKGSFWADPKTLGLLWLEVEADEIPERLDLLSATERIEYEPMRIGDRDIVLPQSAELRMVDADGTESRNLVEFTHCRSFSAETKIRFDEPAPLVWESAAAAKAAERGAIPAGLMVTIALWTPLNGHEPVGALIEGRVAAGVRQKGKVVIPEGAVVRGRLRRMEAQDGYFMVGLEYDEIEIGGAPSRFYGNVQEVEKPAKFMLRGPATGARRRVLTEEIYAGYVPGVALFLVDGKELSLARGFKTVWRTGAPR
jgi:hypothetical protein